MHHLRWMKKGIYSLKMWMFRSQFKLTATQQRAHRKLCIFVSCVYVESWAVANIAVIAPSWDINLLKRLESYQIINQKISTAALQKMASQLWFLSKELVGSTLFNDELDNGTKDKMILAMKEKERGDPLTRVAIDLEIIHQTA